MHKKSIKGEITQKILKRELSFLYVPHHHNLFDITEVSSKYSKWFSPYTADKKMFTDRHTYVQMNAYMPGSSL